MARSIPSKAAAAIGKAISKRQDRRLGRACVRCLTNGILALTGLTACLDRGGTGAPIPAVDGPLALELRYPIDGAILTQDSTAAWGTTGTGQSSLEVNGRRIRVEPNGAFAGHLALPAGDTAVLRFLARAGGATAERVVRILRRPGATGASAGDAAPVRDWAYRVRLRRLPTAGLDSATQARPIFTRWHPEGAVAFGIAQGTRVFADARTDEQLRLRLAPALRVWVPAADAEVLGPELPRSLPLRDPQIRSERDHVVLSYALEEPVFSHVESGAGRLVWTVYGVEAATGDNGSAPPGAIVRSFGVLPGPAGAARIDLALAEEPLGWKTEWRDGRLALHVRPRPPAASNLSGWTIGLDAGHPPEGTTGAAGLREDSMTLAVARAAAERLRALGARPVLIREDESPVSLDERIARAERSDVHVFLSIHGNSPGPGRPPSAVLGTFVYWTQQNAYPLARALHRNVAAAMHQRGLAVVREDLAVLRPTWFAAVLVEGTAMVVPEREAFLRTQAGVDAYADGLVAGLRDWVGVRSPGAPGRQP